jgi:quinol monooxygenase YgiN
MRDSVAAMTQIARYGRAAAREGHGEELAGRLLAAAAALADDPGCELYLINRQSDSPDTLWVTELWRSQADLDASLQQIEGSDEVAAVKALVEDFEIVELDLLGGKGPAPPPPPRAPGAAPHTIHRLTDTEDAAAKHGLGAFGEARFVSGDLGAAQTGVSHHRLRPGAPAVRPSP